jgi:CheY-like chemotaxis protein
MDIQLPGMDGITAMKQLKADPQTAKIPIIAITASAMTHNRTTMLAEGFDGYQTKPIGLKEFLAEVQRVLTAEAKNSK